MHAASQGVQNKANLPPRTRRKQFWRLLLIFMMTVGLALAATARILWQSLEHQPSFYQAALHENAEAGETEDGGRLIDHLTHAANGAQQEKHWSVSLSPDEINDWLRLELPQKHPELLGEDVIEPRVAIEEDKLLFGCKLRESDVVYSAAIKVSKDGDDRLAIQLLGFWMGALPAPSKVVQDEVRSAAENLETPVRWTRVDGHPTLIVNLPPEIDINDRKVAIRNVEIKQEAIVITGETVTPSEEMTSH